MNAVLIAVIAAAAAAAAAGGFALARTRRQGRAAAELDADVARWEDETGAMARSVPAVPASAGGVQQPDPAVLTARTVP